MSRSGRVSKLGEASWMENKQDFCEFIHLCFKFLCLVIESVISNQSYTVVCSINLLVLF